MVNKEDLLDALSMLKNVFKYRDIEDAHNILINGSFDMEDEDEKYELMEKEVDEYCAKLREMITFVSQN